MASRARKVALWGLVAALLGGGWAWAAYRADMRQHRAGFTEGTFSAPTRHGEILYRTGGTGPAVLVIHGAGGGTEQGALIARALAGDAVRWIAPARFGYDGAALPADASMPAQARALADLLDALDLPRVGVMAISGGVPAALHLAGAQPDRVAALVLLSSAPFAPLSAEEQATPLPVALYDALFASDLPYWAMLRLAPGLLRRAFDAAPDAAPVADADPAEEAFVEAMLAAFLPVTARRAGVANEGAAIDPRHPAPMDAIASPALIVHARDDTIAPVASARFLQENLPDAELLLLPEGGHLLLGHHAPLRNRIAAFWQAHLDEAD